MMQFGDEREQWNGMPGLAFSSGLSINPVPASTPDRLDNAGPGDSACSFVGIADQLHQRRPGPAVWLLAG
jgi:hypothetical protein